MEIKSTRNCGCKVAVDEEQLGFSARTIHRAYIILYCSKHEAAPDLLEACKRLLWVCQNGLNPGALIASMDKAEKAIARATGKGE